MNAAEKQQVKRTLEHIATMRKEADKLSCVVVDIVKKDFLNYLHTEINTPALGACQIKDEDISVEIFANENKFIVGIKHYFTPTAKQFVNKLLRAYERQTPGVDCGIQHVKAPFDIDNINFNNPEERKFLLDKIAELGDPSYRVRKR